MSVAACMAARTADQRANRASSGARAASASPALPIWDMAGAARPVTALCVADKTAPAASSLVTAPGAPDAAATANAGHGGIHGVPPGNQLVAGMFSGGCPAGLPDLADLRRAGSPAPGRKRRSHRR
jgi:hypothetical protein